MIASMTAFGRAKAEAEDKDITVEIRSVNSRYFDCSVKAPHVFAPYEEKIKGYLQKEIISRGKVDVCVSVDRHGSFPVRVELDTAMAEGYIAALRRLVSEYGLTDDISAMTVARNGDLFTTARAEEDEEKEWEQLYPVLVRAAKEFSERRIAEGKRTEADIREKLSLVRTTVDEIERLSVADKVNYHDKLEARIRTALADAKITPDEGRLLTEVAIFADRIAVDEELARLRSHFAAFDEISASREPSGRRLDFLMQEMNREINTIGSKACNAEIAHAVVTVKGELEKIREQIQNVE